jgi:hypothetical protein
MQSSPAMPKRAIMPTADAMHYSRVLILYWLGRRHAALIALPIAVGA